MPWYVDAGSDLRLAVTEPRFSLSTPGLHIPFQLTATSGKEGGWLGLAELSSTCQKQCYEWLYNLAPGGESSKGGNGRAWSEGEESPHHQVGDKAMLLLHPEWLLPAFWSNDSFSEHTPVFPLMLSFFFSPVSSCPSVIFPLSLLRCKLNPYTQTTPCRFLFCPFFNQIPWTFCTEF